jgi:hypothetical protein
MLHDESREQRVATGSYAVISVVKRRERRLMMHLRGSMDEYKFEKLKITSTCFDKAHHGAELHAVLFRYNFVSTRIATYGIT